MADLVSATAGLIELCGTLAGPAARAFFSTALAMPCLGLFAGLGAAYALGEAPLFVRLGLLAYAVVAFGLLGLALAGQRAIGRALLAGVERTALGSKAVGLVFDALEGTRPDAFAQRLPLERAEAALREVVERLISAPEAGGGLGGRLRRGVRRRLVEQAESVTLAAFRAEGDGGGGLDLRKVRDALAGKADEAIAERIRGALLRVTALFVLAGAAAVCVGYALALRIT